MSSNLEFLAFLDEWMSGLKPAPLSGLAAPAERLALVSVDMVNGFCHQGPLASPRVKRPSSHPLWP